MPYVLRLIAVSPMAGWFEGAAKVRRHEAVRAAVINVCQGTQRSEELEGKQLHGAAWWRVGSGVEKINFSAHQSATIAKTALPSIYK